MRKNKKCLLLILILVIIIAIPKLYKNIMKYQHKKEIIEYINSDKYKERQLKEEQEKENKYKNIEPFIGMDLSYIGYTKWGMWDKHYEDHGKTSFGVYLWLSDTEVYDKNYNIPMTRINHHKCRIGEPKIEREVHVMSGTRNKKVDGYYIQEYYEEITEIVIYNKDGSINKINKY